MFPRYFTLKSTFKGKQDTISFDSTPGSRCSSSESDDLEDIYQEKQSFDKYDYPNDYWKFLKSVKYLSYGRPFITVLSFITMIDCDFQDPIMLKCLEDHRILEILLNVLHCYDKRVQMVSLRFLQKLCTIRMIRQKIVYLGGIESMISLLKMHQIDMKQAVAEAITSVADFHKAWTAVRLSGGIALLANMMYLPSALLLQDEKLLTKPLLATIDAAKSAAEALFTVCLCRKNQVEFLLCGALSACQNVLKTSHTQLAAVIMQLVQRCASNKYVRLAIRTLGLLDDFKKHFYSEDQKLMQAAAQAAYICAEGDESKRFFGEPGFVDKLYEIIQQSTFHSDEDFMIAISGALWKSCENKRNSKRLQTMNAVPFLLQLLSSQSSKVQENIVACLTCCMTNPQARTILRKNNGVETLIGLLNTIHAPLIMHLNKVLAVTSVDNDCLILMLKHNALRLIWSHLKNIDPSVISNTAWQLASILKNVENSAVYIRSLVGGVQLLIDLLRSNHTRILTPVCALIVILSKDEENLRLLTDYQVVKRLSKLTNTKCRRLRYHLCMAITACCPFRDNRREFANRKVVLPLIRMLKSKSAVVAGAAAHALCQLSLIPKWCAAMYNSPKVYEILMEQMQSDDHSVQQCAADIIQRMRLFVLNRDDNIPEWMIEKHVQFL